MTHLEYGGGDLLSHAVGRGEDVLPGDKGAAAELSPVLKQGCDPRPLSLVSRPPVDHLEGVLIVIIEPLLLLGHGAILVVSDGVILSNTAGVWVGGARTGGALGWGRLLCSGDRGGGVRSATWGRRRRGTLASLRGIASLSSLRRVAALTSLRRVTPLTTLRGITSLSSLRRVASLTTLWRVTSLTTLRRVASLTSLRWVATLSSLGWVTSYSGKSTDASSTRKSSNASSSGKSDTSSLRESTGSTKASAKLTAAENHFSKDHCRNNLTISHTPSLTLLASGT